MIITDLKNNFLDVIQQAIEVLANGGVIVAPSDTVYGLLVDATNEQAILKLMKIKNRPAGKSISVFVSDFSMMKHVVEISEKQQQMLLSLLPGPFTIVLPSKHVLSPLLEAEDATLGVRLVNYTFITELVKAYGKPLTATSANLSGLSSNHSVPSLLNQLSEKKKNLIDLIIDAGQLPKNKPSTVLNLSESTLKILRQGDVVWKNFSEFCSNNEDETKKIAQELLKKIENNNLICETEKATVVILKGDLGAGKTVFVKGMAAKLGVNSIISPSFTICYEYKISSGKMFENIYHYDLYNVESSNEFEHLGIDDYLKPNNLLFFEWGEKAGDLLKKFQEKALVYFVEIIYTDQNKRLITIKNN